MDTTETYIKMSDCPEIQDYKSLDALYGGHYWIAGDYYWIDGLTHGYYSFTMRPTGYYNATWLPRQDQLQEMLPYQVGEAKDNFWSALAGLFEWSFHEKWLDYIPLSMEQLWLAFVMKEKYNKTWDGESWKTDI